MAIRMNGQDPGDLGPPFRKRQIRYNSAQGFKQDAPFDVRTGKDVPLVYDPKDQVALLEVIEEHKDFIICEGLNPYTEEWMERCFVAKPYLIQMTPFDGKTIQIEEQGGAEPPVYSTVTYEYDEDDWNKRTATTTDSEGVKTEVEESMRVPYFIQDEEETYARDVICAIRTTVVTEDESQTIDDTGLIARNDDGQPIDFEFNVVEEDKAVRIQWLDLNTAARKWSIPFITEGVFPLDLLAIGGSEGDATSPCTYRYNVYPFESDDMLMANQSPVELPHRYKRPNLGVRKAANFGYGNFNKDGELVIGWVNEIYEAGVCATTEEPLNPDPDPRVDPDPEPV